MATLEELVIQLVAESGQLRAEMNNATKAVGTATDKMDKSLKEFTENSSKNMSTFQTAMATGIGFLGSQAVTGAFTALKDAAGFLFDELLVKGVAAAQAQEVAINRLNTSLALTGIYSRETSKEMQEFASSIQAVSKYGDEAVLETSALIQSLGGLEKEGLKKATQAAVDMSAALGIDLRAAATLVGKAAAGEVSSFSRYGVAIEKGTTNAETFTNALEKLNTKFGGAAAAQVKTYEGAITQLANTWGDLTEIIGDSIVKNQAVLNVLTSLNALILETSGSLGENSTAFKEVVANGLILFLDAAVATIATLDALVRAYEFATAAAKIMQGPAIALATAFIAMTQGTAAAGEFLSNMFDDVKGGLLAFTDEGDGKLSKLTDTFAQLSASATMGLQSIKDGADSTIEPTNAVIDANEKLKLTEEQKQAAMKKLGEVLNENSALMVAHYEHNKTLLAEDLENELTTREEYNALLIEQAQLHADTEMEILNQKKANGLLTETAFATESLKIKTKQAQEEKKIKDQAKKDDETRQQMMLQGYSQFTQGLSSLSTSSNKELAAIGKAAAITNATINAYVAIQNALANVPYPANIAASIGIGVQAFANVARISGIGLNKGGTLAGGGANVDSVPASLTKGETVVTRDLTNKMNDFFNNGGGSNAQSGNIVIELTMRDQLVEFIEAKIIERQATGVSLIGAT